MPTILSLGKIHEGIEYFEPNRSQLEFLPATKNHHGGLGDFEDESDAKIFSAPTLKLASNQLHTCTSNWCQGSHSKLKETMIDFLSKLILTAATSVTWRSKVCSVVLQLQYASTTQAQALTTRRTSRLSARTIDHWPNRNTPQYHWTEPWMEHHFVCQLCGLWKGLR